MKSQKEYFAFISYSHKDEKYAKWLWHKLEHYHLPVSVRKSNPTLPQYIRPVFKDTSELSAGVLPDEVNEVLYNSKYLIVICSPRAAKSKWVNNEVQTFIDMGRYDKIIPFIIDGIPFSPILDEKCFTSALLNLPKEQELLAVNINDMGRDAAVVKVVAYMFGLKFDILWQRFKREQRNKRSMWMGASVLFAAVGLGVGSYFIKQNHIIETQNDRLSTLISELTESNNTYSELQADLKRYVYAGEMRGNGCDDISLQHFAYHPDEPLIAFSDDWGIWLHNLNSDIENLLPIDEKYGFRDLYRLCFSTDGTELTAEGSFGIYIWNVEKCKLLGHYWSDDKDMHCFETKFPDIDKESLIARRLSQLSSTIDYKCIDGKLTIRQRKNLNDTCSTKMEMDEDSIFLCLPNPVYNEILFITGKRAALYDIGEKEFVLFFKGYNKDDYSMEFDNSGEILRVGKTFYTRTIKIDTIKNLKYTTKPIEDYPYSPKIQKYQYDEITHASMESTDLSIIYRHGNMVKKLEVLRKYSGGNGQEYLSFPVFAGSNRIVAIVEQGKHRIYSTTTWTLTGTLDNYVWDSFEQTFGNEGTLGHAESFIATAKYIDNKLYVVSSGGIVRIYNVNRPRLEAVVELPIKMNDDEYRIGPMDKCDIADDGSRIYYSFHEVPYYYICELPHIKK